MKTEVQRRISLITICCGLSCSFPLIVRADDSRHSNPPLTLNYANHEGYPYPSSYPSFKPLVYPSLVPSSQPTPAPSSHPSNYFSFKPSVPLDRYPLIKTHSPSSTTASCQLQLWNESVITLPTNNAIQYN